MTSNNDTAATRTGYTIDESALARWMAARIEGYAGPLAVTQFRGGQSNPTYKLTSPGRSYVLRRKPSGPLLRGAHAIDREARVLSSLASVDFPVPRVYGLCTDESVIGTWFYVMEMVEGRIFWDPALSEITRDQRPEYFDAMNATIAQLHRIDYEKIGLGDYGRPGNYLQRQIARWSKQYLEDADAGRDPDMDRLLEWLPAHIPRDRDETSVVHGDFRIDNIIFHPTLPKVLAVIDWELSTLGNPISDFVYHLMLFRLPPSLTSGLALADLEALNIPSEAAYTAAYCRRNGRDGIQDLDFYMAFNMFRFAAILHGIKARMMRGTAVSADAASLVAHLHDWAQLAVQQTRRRRSLP